MEITSPARASLALRLARSGRGGPPFNGSGPVFFFLESCISTQISRAMRITNTMKFIEVEQGRWLSQRSPAPRSCFGLLARCLSGGKSGTAFRQLLGDVRSSGGRFTEQALFLECLELGIHTFIT